jgi:type IV pilus assembly protein PilY1
LLQHAFTAEDIAVSGDDGVVSRGRISTATPSNTVAEPRGWMIDLAPIGDDGTSADCRGAERVVSAPQVRQGRVVFVSIIPGGACVAGGASWINALDVIDGSRLSVTPFDFNLDGYFDRADLLEAQSGERTPGSSIRVTAESEAGIYSAPAMLGLGGGELLSILSDSEGNLIQLEESNAYGWRTWLQLE